MLEAYSLLQAGAIGALVYQLMRLNRDLRNFVTAAHTAREREARMLREITLLRAELEQAAAPEKAVERNGNVVPIWPTKH